MNYRKIYGNIIKRAKLQKRIKGCEIYYESHHILPKSLGGKDFIKNKVLLTAKEHYICHRLLIKIFKHNKRKWIISMKAFLMMKPSYLHKDRFFSSRHFDEIRNILYNKNTGLCVGINHPCYGRKHTVETRLKLSDKAKISANTPEGRARRSKMAKEKTKEQRNFINNKIRGSKRTVDQKKNMSISHLGLQLNEKNGMSKPISVDNIIYPSVREYCRRESTVSLNQIYYKVNNKKFTNIFYLKD